MASSKVPLKKTWAEASEARSSMIENAAAFFIRTSFKRCEIVWNVIPCEDSCQEKSGVKATFYAYSPY